MKQYISKSQLKELTQKQMDKLLMYMNDKDYMPHGSQMMLHNNGWYLAEFLNIGEMIEFLDENDEIGQIYKDSEGWSIADCVEIGKSKELCDALWEAVKEVLEVI